MTRKDYRAIANSFNYDLRLAKAGKLRLNTAEYGIRYAAEGLCSILAQDNPRFDREKFMAAVTKDAS